MASIELGMHTGPQNLKMDALKRLWKMGDEAGMKWISVWDHFYANPIDKREDPCFEGVASMAALASLTQNVRVGCLMFCALYRNPALLAKSIVTIDHISQGRAELGLGAGWLKEEFDDFGYEFPPIGKRLDQLEEALQVIRALFQQPKTDFAGKYHTLNAAVCAPKPLNPNLRIWVGGRGPKRTPQIAARYADGFNAPYISPDEFAQRMQVIDATCAKVGRDPKEITRSINCHFLLGADEAGIRQGKARAAKMPDDQQSGAMIGGGNEAIDLIGRYLEAGAQGLNVAFRAPIDWAAFEMYLDKVLPVFHR